MTSGGAIKDAEHPHGPRTEPGGISVSDGGSEGSIRLSVIPGEPETSVVCSYEEKEGWQTRLVARGANAERGRFRAFLLAALKHFLGHAGIPP